MTIKFQKVEVQEKLRTDMVTGLQKVIKRQEAIEEQVRALNTGDDESSVAAH